MQKILFFKLHKIIVKQIKERNLNLNNETPLHLAAFKDSNKIGELLISKGADINAIDIIYQITINTFLIILKQIKERYLNFNNKTPLYFARGKMIEPLGSKGAK